MTFGPAFFGVEQHSARDNRAGSRRSPSGLCEYRRVAQYYCDNRLPCFRLFQTVSDWLKSPSSLKISVTLNTVFQESVWIHCHIETWVQPYRSPCQIASDLLNAPRVIEVQICWTLLEWLNLIVAELQILNFRVANGSDLPNGSEFELSDCY